MKPKIPLKPELILLVGPPGSGKSTMAQKYVNKGYIYVNQDLQGKDHLNVFDSAIANKQDVIVDRMNFSKGQRNRYLELAKKNDYWTAIIVLHESLQTCFDRCLNRKDHLTIKDETAAKSALNTFFSKYERVTDDEADDVIRVWPSGDKPLAIICDLDGTLCDVEHRRHFVRVPEGQKKNWAGFFAGIKDDTVNEWCADILYALDGRYQIVYCSGRSDDHRYATEQWLEKMNLWDICDEHLYMRNRSDSRKDDIVKAIIYEFEILTRFEPYFVIDDRPSVCRMWRSFGLTVLQCNDEEF